jgi:hypothetical protein
MHSQRAWEGELRDAPRSKEQERCQHRQPAYSGDPPSLNLGDRELWPRFAPFRTSSHRIVHFETGS